VRCNPHQTLIIEKEKKKRIDGKNMAKNKAKGRTAHAKNGETEDTRGRYVFSSAEGGEEKRFITGVSSLKS